MKPSYPRLALRCLTKTTQVKSGAGLRYNDLAYFVIGNTLYEFKSAGTGVSRGTLQTSTGLVSLAHNGVNGTNQEIMIADGTTKYIFNNVTKTTAEVTDVDNLPSDIVAFQDGYFIYNEADDDSFGITELYNGNIVLSNFVASGDPDEVVSLVSEQRQLFIFKEKSTSVWYNSGDVDSIFERFQGGYTQTGCAAAHTAKRFDNSVIWLSRNERGDAQVVRLLKAFSQQSYRRLKLIIRWRLTPRIDDAFAYVYQDEGHEFYVLTFPTAMVTWVYDATTKCSGIKEVTR